MATITQTTTASGPAVAAKTAPPGFRNPKDSMKSTWRRDRSRWGAVEHIYQFFNIHHIDLDGDIPVHDKSEKIPILNEWSAHRWILYHALIPMAIQQIYITYFRQNLHPVAAFFLYSTTFNLIGIHELNVLRRLSHTCGFLDGDKHERDGVPDHSVHKVLRSLISTTTSRGALAVMLAYRRSEGPSTTNWALLPLEIGLYGVVLDFWFYWYHRTMHQIESFWKFHRTHHLTKHPNPLLTLYADSEQEFFDIAGIPFLAWASMKLLGFPMGFYEWWICNQYVVFTELSGHSGLRIHTSPPSTLNWLLEYFNCELVTEDHDLHHRQGWKKSHNYGKQTRVWDRIFGTCGERIESRAENVDRSTKVVFPLF